MVRVVLAVGTLAGLGVGDEQHRSQAKCNAGYETGGAYDDSAALRLHHDPP